MFGVPLPYPKNDASKTVRKGLNKGFGFSRFRVQAPGFRVKGLGFRVENLALRVKW
jgi:hypothetical protein